MFNFKHTGSTFDDFLAEEGLEAEVTANAIKRVLAWQMIQVMEKETVTKTELATRMKTSRAALNRLLDPNNTSVSLHTLEKAAAALGRKLEVHLV
jgi:DNA-binding Xre family transcriptional regulator